MTDQGSGIGDQGSGIGDQGSGIGDQGSGTPKKKRNWILIVIGILFLLTVIGISGVVFTVAWFRNNIQITEDQQAGRGQGVR